MNRRGFRVVGWLGAAVLALSCAGLSLAFVQKAGVTPLSQKEFFKPDLHISTGNVKFDEMAGHLVNAGHCSLVAWGWEEAARILEQYLAGQPTANDHTSTAARASLPGPAYKILAVLP